MKGIACYYSATGNTKPVRDHVIKGLGPAAVGRLLEFLC